MSHVVFAGTAGSGGRGTGCPGTLRQRRAMELELATAWAAFASEVGRGQVTPSAEGFWREVLAENGRSHAKGGQPGRPDGRQKALRAMRRGMICGAIPVGRGRGQLRAPTKAAQRAAGKANRLSGRANKQYVVYVNAAARWVRGITLHYERVSRRLGTWGKDRVER